MHWPARGQVLVQTIYLSVDPYMRGRMSSADSYAPPLAIGEVMPGGGVGRVLESLDPSFTLVPAAEVQRDRPVVPEFPGPGPLEEPKP
jgi:NADPH-dependent curcumin reductase CurA